MFKTLQQVEYLELITNYIHDLKEAAGLIEYLGTILDNYDFDDNYRFAPVNNKEALKIYNDTKSSGCCGYYDEIIEWNGKKYHFGFNWGH
jgi:hypothetical protein